MLPLRSAVVSLSPKLNYFLIIPAVAMKVQGNKKRLGGGFPPSYMLFVFFFYFFFVYSMSVFLFLFSPDFYTF